MRHLLTDLRGNPISFASRRRQRRYRHPHLPTLFYLVQNRSWEDVVRRARSHPNEIVIQDDMSGNTPLHIACRLDPPSDVVRALFVASHVLNAEGATPLHVAATHRCSAQVIKALLESSTSKQDEADRKSATPPTAILTRMGRAPIHYACMSFRGLGVEAFRVLLEATIQSGHVSIDNNGTDYDLKDADEDYDDDMESTSSMVLNVMTMRDCTGQTPLGLLFRRYKERVRCVIKAVESLRTEQDDGSSTSLAAAVTVQADLGELWEKARLIVGKLTEERLQREGDVADLFQMDTASPAEAAVAQEAAAWAAEQHRSSMKEEQQQQQQQQQQHQPSDCATVGSRKFRIVHASVGLTGYGCPPEMILLAISIHPNQVREMDEDGNLPLHIAAVASSFDHIDTDQGRMSGGAQLHASDEDSVVSGMSFLSNITTCSNKVCFDQVIKILLKHYPAAARIPHGRTGRLPFVLAIDAGRRTWDDGVKSLLDAYPPALESRRLDTKLYPSILMLLARPTTTTSNNNSTSEGGGSWRKRLRMKSRRSNSTCTSLTTLFELMKAKPDLLKEATVDVTSTSK